MRERLRFVIKAFLALILIKILYKYLKLFSLIFFLILSFQFVNLQLPNCSGHLCVSIGKFSRFIGHPALIVSLKLNIYIILLKK